MDYPGEFNVITSALTREEKVRVHRRSWVTETRNWDGEKKGLGAKESRWPLEAKKTKKWK